MNLATFIQKVGNVEYGGFETYDRRWFILKVEKGNCGSCVIYDRMWFILWLGEEVSEGMVTIT